MSKIVKDDIDRLYDYDIYVPNRTIYMGSLESDISEGESGVDAAMAERVIKGLHLLDNSAPTGDKPITVIMNNPGGDWYHGMAIYDAIKACKNHVTVIVYGYAMSMGSIILQAADERVLAPNARMMIHYGTMGMGDTHTKIFRKWADETKKIDKKMLEIYMDRIKVKHPNFSKSKLDEMCNFDTILTAEEAVELGLADKVL